ncbi:MAG: hypothetical protein O2916_10480 [Proteobacteria bacterium]|nr:hypothetical protein [Pseudomonadota bacterium]
MNKNIPCPYCSFSKGFVYIQSHYQCLNCKRAVDDCCNGERVDCIIGSEIKNKKILLKKNNFASSVN